MKVKCERAGDQPRHFPKARQISFHPDATPNTINQLGFGMTFDMHPIVLAAFIGVLLALGAIFVAGTTRSVALRILMIAVTLILLVPAGLVLHALYPELLDNRFRTYKKFYADIQVGMAREQVFATMARHYPRNGVRESPTILQDTPTALNFFMNPETSTHPNCEGIFLTMEEGRVTNRKYSPD